ncbi:MAG: FAD-dependent oxidoreductase [Pseudomonadota bacterium]
MSKRHVAVIGAGIVGVSTALHLLRDGHKVTLIDRDGPAAGTSQGNAGVLAALSMVPVTAPGLIAKAPGMLLDRRQPLFLRWTYLPRLAPWLVRYLSHANAKDTARIAAAMAPIVGDSLAEHEALARGTPAARWIVPCDYVYAYPNRAAFEADAFAWDLRRQHGVVWETLEGPAAAEYEPGLAPAARFLVRVGGHGRITDPKAYVQDLAAAFVAEGGALRLGRVTDLAQTAGQVTGVMMEDGRLACDAAVVTTGVWSGPLAKALGVAVPLESERGYHIELWEPSVMPRAPVMIAAGKFVATPMEGRLRLAGVVEFGGLKAGPSRAPFDLLLDSAKAAFPGLSWARATEWMGHRPAPSDSIPLIGPVPGLAGAWLGFGHHHVGLTGGPKTGRLIAESLGGRKPNIDLAPYSPARFAGGHSAPETTQTH